MHDFISVFFSSRVVSRSCVLFSDGDQIPALEGSFPCRNFYNTFVLVMARLPTLAR
jgi:hypothetical protein